MKMIQNTKTLTVEGMSCSNCELRIENKLKKLTGVISVQASYAKESVSLVLDGASIKEDEIVNVIEQLGYIVKPNKEKTLTLPVTDESFHCNKLQRRPHASSSDIRMENDSSRRDMLKGVKLIGVLAVIVIVLIVIRNAVAVDLTAIDNMGYGILFVVGVVTSLHCITMCGGINLSVCMSYKPKNNGRFSKLYPSILYNIGRVISYTLIGGMVGVIGSAININHIVGVRGIGTLVAGSFMILMGLNMMDVFPQLRKFIPKMPKIFGNKLYNGIGKNSPFIIGLLNGLLPCGPLQSVQLYALGTGSFVSGALSMFLFSMGTVPAIFGFGAISSILSKQFTKKMMKLSGILVMVLGIFMIAMILRNLL